MPYIDPGERCKPTRLDPRTPGQLNYAITMLLIGYVKRKGPNYTHINDCLGACMGAMLEFQRRLVAGYEDRKIAQNGDLYPPVPPEEDV